MSTISKHLDAIKSGEVTRSNVIGLRKAFNTYERQYRGWSVGVTAPKITATQELALRNAIAHHKPRIVGQLHDSGVKQLQSRRYRKQLESVADIVADLQAFRLDGFSFIGSQALHTTPVYRAFDSQERSFLFRNIPWQSGGNGPELVEPNYF